MFSRWYILLCTVMTVTCQNIIEAGPSGIDSSGSLECQRSLYTYRVTQADENGKQCWDTLSVMACWGRCDSNEVCIVYSPKLIRHCKFTIKKNVTKCVFLKRLI